MRELEEILKAVCDRRAEIKLLEEQRLAILNSTMPAAQRDELTQSYQKFILRAKNDIEDGIAELVRWPPHKIEHFAKLKQFMAQFPYEKSVFIMTKYPGEPPSNADNQLAKVIETVKQAVIANGYTPHLASDKAYHPELFKNIELYMLGCSKAIAIVESKHTAELNPNVTMEWGWFRCTDRDVLFLVEKEFDRARADIEGLIKEQFVWADPEPGIKAAVEKWLKP